MSRTLVIGDIHGGLKALQQVLNKAALTGTDRLIFLGDYVDGWSESSGVIGFLIQLSSKYNCTFLKGNHDDWCEGWLLSGIADPKWLMHGGQETVNSYSHVDGYTKQQHLDWLQQLPFYYIDQQQQLFIHAGFTSPHGPHREYLPANCCTDRTLWEMAIAMDPGIQPGDLRYPKRLQHFTQIFIGHTPTTNFEVSTPMQCANVWNVDTGAAFKGRITAMDISSKTYWQSDPLPLLYPNEIGRNK